MRSVWFLCFFLSGVIVFCSCKNDPGEVNAITKKDSFPMLTTQNVDVVSTDSAKVKWHLTAPLAEDFQGMDAKSVFPHGVFVEFYNDSEIVNSSLKADYAEFSEKAGIALVKRNVIVVNNKGEQLNTEKLTWDQKKRRIYTDAFVKITTADQVIMGNGLESDEAFTNYEIKDITGTIMLDQE